MKKALLITRVSGFIPQFEMNNVKILKEMGYEIHYATNFDVVVYGKDNSRLEGTGIIGHQVDFDRKPYPWLVSRAYKQIKKVIMEGDFDLIHCHMPTSAAIARSAANSVRKETGKNVPVLYTAHGFHFFTGAPLQNWLYYPVEKHYSRYTDRLILINGEDYNRASKFPIRGRAERIMGVGMDLKRFEPYKKKDWHVEENPPEKKFDIYEEYDIDRDNAVLVSVGELTKLKNHITVIEAFKELTDLKISYLICGAGPKEQELKARVKELGLEKRIHFSGYVTNVLEILNQCDCFVFPSRREGLPVAMMEAMAVGLPVIATSIRGITDLIVHTKGGYLVNDWEPENYAVKIRRMFTEEAGKSEVKRDLRREAMGEWNQERIQNFSIEVVEKKMREIYAAVEEEANKNK